MTGPAVPYISVDALKDTLSTSGDPTGTAGSLAREILTEKIETAQGQVDARLAAAGYAVPFTTAPPLVRDITGAIAAYLADLTYRRGKAPASQLDPVLQRYQWANGLLDAIAKGTALVPGVDAPDRSVPEGSGAVAVVAINTYDQPLFSRDELPGGPPPGADDWWW